ncbi:3447_t:CDS:2 [Paraglomus occultum]|uniref:3447_t:CDS:1 n=1 Tax=Paraglomus occultum TaxID=144539 RepID=A0A9N9D947_9GLOM|nr:3447_t:CDS:2 [Paraglomus occultum]
MVKLSLNDACDIAKSRNGICLSTVYNNSTTPMIWKCHQGHQWPAPFHRIKHAKKWCPQCASNRRCSIEEAKQIAHNRNVGVQIVHIIDVLLLKKLNKLHIVAEMC